MTKYWLTTHWPPEINKHFNCSIYLYDGTQTVGTDIKPGDRVWVYQSKGGRLVVRENPDGSKYTTKRQPGREGVIALAEVIDELRDIGSLPEQYDDGSIRCWKWKAEARLINQSGFIPRQELNVLLGNEPDYGLRGFGTQHSGLKQISEDEHNKLLDAFNRNQPPETLPKVNDTERHFRPGHDQGGEGPEHKRLKERIAANPSDVLGIAGLTTIQTEYSFTTGDRIDVLLRTSENQYIAVEVEVAVDLNDISGVSQAVKYSRMYSVVCRRKYEEVRGFLVAHKITDDVKKLCSAYGVETFEVGRG
jgi:hypothetical protein